MKKETRELLDQLKANKISLDLWAGFEKARASMKIKGFDMTDDVHICSSNEYKVEGGQNKRSEKEKTMRT